MWPGRVRVGGFPLAASTSIPMFFDTHGQGRNLYLCAVRASLPETQCVPLRKGQMILNHKCKVGYCYFIQDSEVVFRGVTL